MTLDTLATSVVYLRGAKEFGSGFLVATQKPYLVTAAHVARALAPDSTMTIRSAGDTPKSLALGDLAGPSPALPWQLHKEADVAVMALTLSEATAKLLSGRFVSLDWVQRSEEAPDRERTLVVFGFPLSLGTVGRFSVISSSATPASGLLRIARADTKREATFFLIDKPSIGGFSGGPVFVAPGAFAQGNMLRLPDIDTPPALVGVVHGTISDNTGGKLAAIVPSIYVRQMIESIERKKGG